MKKILSYFSMIAVIALLAVGFAFKANAEPVDGFWTKGALGHLYTNSGNGQGNAIIHIGGCFIGPTTNTPCSGGGGGGGTVTSITGQNSIVATPNPITTTGTLHLVNDSTTPGNSQYYGTNGSGTKGFFALPSPGAGTVTSVGLSLPSIFTVSGSPVTSTGTLTGTFNTQTANTVFAGPASGSAATPTFRSLTANDIPALPYLSTVAVDGTTITGDGTVGNPLVGHSSFPALTQNHFYVGDASNSPVDAGNLMTYDGLNYLVSTSDPASTNDYAQLNLTGGNPTDYSYLFSSQNESDHGILVYLTTGNINDNNSHVHLAQVFAQAGNSGLGSGFVAGYDSIAGDTYAKIYNNLSVWLWPQTDSTGTQALVSDGSGNLSWGPTLAPGGSALIGETSGLISNPASLSTTETWLGDGIIGTGASTTGTTFLGAEAGNTATGADNSTFVGNSAGFNSTSATFSEFMGTGAGSSATNAAHSIFIGNNAGATDSVDNTAGGTSILIGDNTSTAGFQNSIALGAGATNSDIHQFLVAPSYTNVVMGDTGTTYFSLTGAANQFNLQGSDGATGTSLLQGSANNLVLGFTDLGTGLGGQTTMNGTTWASAISDVSGDATSLQLNGNVADLTTNSPSSFAGFETSINHVRSDFIDTGSGDESRTDMTGTGTLSQFTTASTSDFTYNSLDVSKAAMGYHNTIDADDSSSWFTQDKEIVGAVNDLSNFSNSTININPQAMTFSTQLSAGTGGDFGASMQMDASSSRMSWTDSISGNKAQLTLNQNAGANLQWIAASGNVLMGTKADGTDAYLQYLDTTSGSINNRVRVNAGGVSLDADTGLVIEGVVGSNSLLNLDGSTLIATLGGNLSGTKFQTDETNMTVTGTAGSAVLLQLSGAGVPEVRLGDPTGMRFQSTPANHLAGIFDGSMQPLFADTSGSFPSIFLGDRSTPGSTGILTFVHADGNTENITRSGSIVDATTLTLPHNSVRNVVNGDYDIEVTGGSPGTATVNLPVSGLPVGQIYIVSDYDATALTQNIVIDAGSGNTLHYSTVAQTKTIIVNGETDTVKLIDNTPGSYGWKVQSN